MVHSYCAIKFSGFLIAACVTAIAENKQEQFSYTVGPKPIISIRNQYGRIRVTPSSNNRVVATVLHSDTVEVQQQQSGNRIVLGSRLRNATGPRNRQRGLSGAGTEGWQLGVGFWSDLL